MRRGKFKKKLYMRLPHVCNKPSLLWSKDIIKTIKVQAFTAHQRSWELYKHYNRSWNGPFSKSAVCEGEWKANAFPSSPLSSPFSSPLSSSLSVETCGQLLCFHVVRWSKAERDSNCPLLKRSSAWDQGPSRWGDSHENGQRSRRNARGPAWQK